MAKLVTGSKELARKLAAIKDHVAAELRAELARIKALSPR